MIKSKELIAEAFLELLDEKLLNKITVKDIVERCGVNRNTFYYYYQDIPSLLESILTGRIDELVQKHARIGSLQDCIEITVHYFTENRKAVMHVYHALPRDVFLWHLDRLLLYLVNEYIEDISRNMVIGEKDREIIVRFFKCLLVGCILDWLDHGMDYDLIQDSQRIYQLQEDAALQMLKNANH